MVWVPSNVGKPGNETAASATKQATTLKMSDDKLYTHKDLKLLFKNYFQNSWQNHWKLQEE